MNSASKVCAVVVTRNRRALLERCLNALRDQTRAPDATLVVDNESTDGTREWLRTRRDLTLIENENTGGAGGFARGIEAALAQNFDWIWCMDDDGYPEPTALAALLRHESRAVSALNCVLLSESDRERLAFGMPVIGADQRPRLQRPLRTFAELQAQTDEYGLVPAGAFFNGTLLRASAVRQAGNVRAEMFIWGDEQDMHWRLWRVAPVCTVLDAVHRHPEAKPGALPLWKAYYALRNGLYVNRTHMNHARIRNLRLIAISFVRMARAPGGLKLYWQALREGMRGDLHNRIRPA